MTAPKWTIFYLAFVTVMALVFTLLAYINPALQFNSWEALTATGALSLSGPLGLYIARNLATVAVGIFALSNRSSHAVSCAFLLRSVTDAADAIHNAIAGNIPAAGFATVMCVIELFALTQIFKQPQ